MKLKLSSPSIPRTDPFLHWLRSVILAWTSVNYFLFMTFNHFLGKNSEKAMVPHSSTLAWKIPWTEKPVGCSPWGHWESDRTERLHFHFSLSCIGKGNGSPLRCSCLENPRDDGAWWAAVYGVAQSQTQLKRLTAVAAGKNWKLCLLRSFLSPFPAFIKLCFQRP